YTGHSRRPRRQSPGTSAAAGSNRPETNWPRRRADPASLNSPPTGSSPTAATSSAPSNATTAKRRPRSLLLSVMGAFAEFERALVRERQAVGIAAAMARGAYKGRRRLPSRGWGFRGQPLAVPVSDFATRQVTVGTRGYGLWRVPVRASGVKSGA